MKPKLFIGSSVEGLTIAENIKAKLEYSFDIDLWNEGIFGIGNTTIDDLLVKLEDSDFGIFVFTPDDNAIIRKQPLSIVRDNVLYELGLYTGKLGRKNTFIIVPDKLPDDFHLPSDLIGINLGKYDTAKAATNPESAVSTFCTKLKNQIFNKVDYPLGGKWKFTWEVNGSENYKGPISEEVTVFHYENMLKFTHTIRPGESYIIRAELAKRYLTGSFKAANKMGYDGAFQMTINGKTDSFNGLFIGWQNSGTIGYGPCSLIRLLEPKDN